MIIEVPYFKYASQYKLWEIRNRRLVDKYNLKLKVYDGLPGSPWNGGRLPLGTSIPEHCPVSFALTNHTVDDLHHKESHELLKKFHSPDNTILISNLELLDHLQKLYPNYKWIYSITAYDISNGFDGYDEIEKRVDWIVPRNEIIDHTEELYKRNTKQYILLFSFECSGCPLYNEHYKVIGEIVKEDDKTRNHLYACWFKNRKLLTEVGYTEDIYSDYTYYTQKKFMHKLLEIDHRILAGYKVGRNSQKFEKIELELKEITDMLESQ
jgi:hypothetical protein